MASLEIPCMRMGFYLKGPPNCSLKTEPEFCNIVSNVPVQFWCCPGDLNPMTPTGVASVKFFRKLSFGELWTERSHVIANTWEQTVKSLEHCGLCSSVSFGWVIIYVLLTKHCAFLFGAQSLWGCRNGHDSPYFVICRLSVWVSQSSDQ